MQGAAGTRWLLLWLPSACAADLSLLELAYGGSLDMVRPTVADAAEPSLEAVRAATDVEESDGGLAPATYAWRHFVYGEVSATSVADMLDRLGAAAGERYYDLGAGDGKTAAVAWLRGMHATGIELVGRRHAASCAAVGALRDELAERRAARAGSLRMLRGSFLQLDWSDADVVFVASVTFSDELMALLAEAARRLRRGARIVSWRGLPGREFRTIGEVRLRSSWQETDSDGLLPFVLQEKVTDRQARAERESADGSTRDCAEEELGVASACEL
jgi:SAM-dependent methyltransferase